eukprot:6160688-Ditylum_brightwellii.AAC.1
MNTTSATFIPVSIASQKFSNLSRNSINTATSHTQHQKTKLIYKSSQHSLSPILTSTPMHGLNH